MMLHLYAAECLREGLSNTIPMLNAVINVTIPPCIMSIRSFSFRDLGKFMPFAELPLVVGVF